MGGAAGGEGVGSAEAGSGVGLGGFGTRPITVFAFLHLVAFPTPWANYPGRAP